MPENYLGKMRCYCEVVHDDVSGCALSFYVSGRELLKSILLAVCYDEQYDWVPECIQECVRKWLVSYSNAVGQQNPALFIKWVPDREFSEAAGVLENEFAEFLGKKLEFCSVEKMDACLQENPKAAYCAHTIFTDGMEVSSTAPRAVAMSLGMMYYRGGKVNHVNAASYAFIRSVCRKKIPFSEMEEMVSIGAQRYHAMPEVMYDEFLSHYISSVKVV